MSHTGVYDVGWRRAARSNGASASDTKRAYQRGAQPVLRSSPSCPALGSDPAGAGVLQESVVPDRYPVCRRRRQRRDLEVRALETVHSAWHPRDPLSDDSARRIERLGQNADWLRHFPVLAEDVASDSTGLPLLRVDGPVKREAVL